jgi:hypothetical protein
MARIWHDSQQTPARTRSCPDGSQIASTVRRQVGVRVLPGLLRIPPDDTCTGAITFRRAHDSEPCETAAGGWEEVSKEPTHVRNLPATTSYSR